jgi:hypothetical protein
VTGQKKKIAEPVREFSPAPIDRPQSTLGTEDDDEETEVNVRKDNTGAPLPAAEKK